MSAIRLRQLSGKILFSAFALFVVLSGLLYADDIPQQRWLEAYLLIEQADKYASNGDNALALKEYQAAELKLAKITEDFPLWNLVMVAYRQEYCRLRQQYLLQNVDSQKNRLNLDELHQLLKEEQSKNASLQEELTKINSEKTSLTPADNAPKKADDTGGQPEPPPRLPDLQALETEKAKLQQQLLQARQRLEVLEKNDLAWNKAAAGTEKLRQSLAEVLMERDTLTTAVKQAQLDQKDSQAKIEVLRQQLLDAEKRAKIPYNLRTAELNEEITKQQQLLKELLQAQEALRNDLAGQQQAEQTAQELRELQEKAQKAEQNVDAEAAAQLWRQMAEKNLVDPLPALRAAVWHSRLGDAEQVRYWSGNFFNRSFSDVNSLLALSSVMLSHGQWERSLALSSWAVSLAPLHADCWHAMGSVFVAGGLLPSGESQYRHALDLNPEHAPSLLALAVLLAVSEPPRLAEAKQFYQRALAAGSQPEPALEKRFAAAAGE